MVELTNWLRTQFDEDERIARAATDGPWAAEVSGETGHCVIPADAQSTREYVARTQLYAAVFDAEHIAAHDPARVLREIDAKRRLLRSYEDLVAEFNSSGPAMVAYDRLTGSVSALRHAVELLALPYADRPGYREEWRP